ncbi:MAG: ATP-binding protein [Prolixibacteraceae bacterium]|nr:ATP-binding protein [Prolixibacteraceae bacterium]
MDKSIDIQSDIRNICKIEYFINDIFRELKFSRKIFCKIYLAVNEAVTNAIVHGNKSDVNKIVHLNFQDNSVHFKITISDEGNGFDIKNVKDPTHSDNIYKESGRGIFIMNQYADRVKYEENGRIVKLLFNK